MPFTPFHMGPGILFKALLQGSFSLMVFGWAQIVMDIQPLFVMIRGEGNLHGISHTYIGALVLGLFACLTGKYLSEIGLKILRIPEDGSVTTIKWWVAFISAFIGTFSHVALDSIMHSDVHPYSPISNRNGLLGLISGTHIHQFCIFSAIVGAILFFSIEYWGKKRRKSH